MSELSSMPQAVLIGIGVLIVLQIALQIMALVGLVKTPAARVTIGGRKWLWAIIIILGEIAGPILWFVAGRRPQAVDSASASSRERGQELADALYGGSGESRES